MRARDRSIAEVVIRAYAAGHETANTRELAERLVARWDAPPPPRAPAPEKAPIASVVHHLKQRVEEAIADEEVSDACWDAVIARTMVDHHGLIACEACGSVHLRSFLEPHHLTMGAGGRVDEPHLVMALCCDCHRLGAYAAHRRVRWFAQAVVIPWAKEHGFTLPNRKEYR